MWALAHSGIQYSIWQTMWYKSKGEPSHYMCRIALILTWHMLLFKRHIKKIILRVRLLQWKRYGSLRSMYRLPRFQLCNTIGDNLSLSNAISIERGEWDWPIRILAQIPSQFHLTWHSGIKVVAYCRQYRMPHRFHNHCRPFLWRKNWSKCENMLHRSILG
jgi:hypothetical protein